MKKEIVTISKDEYINLLRCKSSLMEQELSSSEPANFAPRKPHSWMNQAEKAEIARLVGLGFRPGEIGHKIGRPVSTISRYIKRLGKLRSTV